MRDTRGPRNRPHYRAVSTCPTCNGYGNVEDLNDPNGPDGWWVETCRTCHGSGEVAA